MSEETNVADQVTVASNVPVVDARSGYPMSETVQTVDEFNAGPVDLSQGSQEAPQGGEGDQGNVTAPEDVTAANERLRQQIARSNKLLSAIGVDPLSDVGEQLENGFVTAEQVRNHFQTPRYNQQQEGYTQTGSQEPAGVDPIMAAQEVYNTAKAKYDAEVTTGEITIETNNGYMTAMQSLNDAKLEGVTQKLAANEQARANDAMTQQANANVNAVLSVAHQTPNYDTMTPEIQQNVDQVSVALTGVIADQEARSMGLDPAQLTPQQYAHFAGKASEQLGKLSEYFIAQGQQTVRSSFTPPSKTTYTPNPAGNSGVSPAVADPYKGATYSNHKDAAQQYAKQIRGVV